MRTWVSACSTKSWGPVELKYVAARVKSTQELSVRKHPDS